MDVPKARPYNNPITLPMEIPWPSRLFITGIDTDAGKSYATGWMAKLIMQEGKSVITQKFVQTGNLEDSEDIEVHRRLMGIKPTPADLIHLTAPIIYSYPASADLAARIDNRPFDPTIVDDATNALASQYEHVLIEGAGGLMVPLNGEFLTIDYVEHRHLPVVLVTNGRLGSINHTLLSLAAISHAGLELFAVVYNPYYDKDKIIADDTRNYIKNYLAAHFPDSLYLEMPIF